MQTPILIETDKRSRVVLPGHANERFLLQENADGSLYLEPAVVVSAAQREYDTTPALQELLARATASKRVTRRRTPIAR
jgi:spore germination protein GerM